MKRVRYFDLLRVVCFIFIIFYHMVVQLSISNFYPIESLSKLYSNDNMHIATLGVSVFFMLSGASLAYTNNEPINYKNFLKKRFLRILIPFYIVYLGCLIIKIILTGSVLSVFPNTPPLWRIIFTLLGLDSWLSSIYGYATFSLGIGEWFIGVLIILYILFPLFHKLMHKNKYLFLTITTCIYIYYIYTYTSVAPMHANIIIKGYEFVLGMYFGTYLTKFKKPCMLLSVPTVVFFLTSDTILDINYGLKITLLGIAFFISFSFLEDYLNNHKLKFVDILSNYSYELFLTHHIVISFLTPIIYPLVGGGNVGVIVLFISEILIMTILSVILKFTTNRILSVLKKSGI